MLLLTPPGGGTLWTNATTNIKGGNMLLSYLLMSLQTHMLAFYILIKDVLREFQWYIKDVSKVSQASFKLIFLGA